MDYEALIGWGLAALFGGFPLWALVGWVGFALALAALKYLE